MAGPRNASGRSLLPAGAAIVVLTLLASGMAVAQTVPTLTTPYPPLASKPVSNPSLSTVKRDCGFSVALTGGDVLWIFCDSTDANAAGSFSYFLNNTAGYGFAPSLTKVREPLSGGKPVQFIRPSPGYNPCTGAHAGEQHSIWPMSAAVVSAPGANDKVVIWFENVCSDPGSGIAGYTQISVGVATYEHNPNDADPLPELAAGAQVLDPNLWKASPDGHTFGEAAVFAQDGYYYLYRCRGFWGCQVARVRKGQVSDTGEYRYWTGTGWSTINPDGPTLALTGGDEPAGAFNVVWLPEMGVYGMGYIEFPGLSIPGVDAVRVRVADTPAGPWGPPDEIRNGSDCGTGCYAGYLHAAFSGIDFLGVTSYDQDHFGWTGAGQVRMVQARTNLSPPPPGVCLSGFADVWSGDDFCLEIGWLKASGITGGFDDATFRPTGTVTRQALAAWFYRQAGSPPGPFPDPGFSDVPPDHPFRNEIAWLAQSGIASGFPDGKFRPADTVTRQAIAAWLHRQAGGPPGPIPGGRYSDVPLDHPFYNAISWVTFHGIADGYSDHTFRPGAVVTRQAAAAYFHRAST